MQGAKQGDQSSSPRSALRSSSSTISSLRHRRVFSQTLGSGSNSARYSLMPSLTARLLSSRSLATNRLRYSRDTRRKKWLKKMPRKVASMGRMLDRSGKKRSREREALAAGSAVRRAANLARLAVRRSSQVWMSLRWSQMAYCRLRRNLGVRAASLAATRGQQALKEGSSVHTSTSTLATSSSRRTRSSRIRCDAYRQSFESIRHRKMFRFVYVTMWNDRASSSSRRRSAAPSPSCASPSPSPSSSCSPCAAVPSCSHQLVRAVSALATCSKSRVSTSFSFSISLWTFLARKVCRKAMRWSAACTFLLNLMSASSASMKPIFCSSSPSKCPLRQRAMPSLTVAMMPLRADGSFWRTRSPHFCTRMQSSSMASGSRPPASRATSDCRKSAVRLPQLQSRLTMVAQFFSRSARLLYPNSATSAASPSPACALSYRNLLVSACSRGAISLFPKAWCSPAARATLVARMWKSGFSTMRLKRVKSSQKSGTVRERGWRSMVPTNSRKVSKMLPSDSLLKKPVIARNTSRCAAETGSPSRWKGLRQAPD